MWNTGVEWQSCRGNEWTSNLSIHRPFTACHSLKISRLLHTEKKLSHMKYTSKLALQEDMSVLYCKPHLVYSSLSYVSGTLRTVILWRGKLNLEKSFAHKTSPFIFPRETVIEWCQFFIVTWAICSWYCLSCCLDIAQRWFSNQEMALFRSLEIFFNKKEQ